jgi:hypothetical protein
VFQGELGLADSVLVWDTLVSNIVSFAQIMVRCYRRVFSSRRLNC